MCMRYITEKERIKALKGSKVKLKALDVVTSFKLIYSIIIFPSFGIFWSIIFAIYCHFYWKQYIIAKSILFYILQIVFLY